MIQRYTEVMITEVYYRCLLQMRFITAAYYRCRLGREWDDGGSDESGYEFFIG